MNFEMLYLITETARRLLFLDLNYVPFWSFDEYKQSRTLSTVWTEPHSKKCPPFTRSESLSFTTSSSSSMASSDFDGILLGMGNPLLDVSAVVDQEFLNK